MVEIFAQGAVIERAGVGVSGCDENVLRRNTGFAAGLRTNRTGNDCGHANQITEHERGALIALAEDDGFGLKRIVRASAEPFIEIAAHAPADGWSDVDGSQACLHCRVNARHREQ